MSCNLLSGGRRPDPDSRAATCSDPAAGIDLAFGAADPKDTLRRVPVGTRIPALDEFAKIRVLTHITADADGVIWNGYRYTVDDALALAGQWLSAIAVHNALRQTRPPVSLPMGSGKSQDALAIIRTATPPKDAEDDLWASAIRCLTDVTDPWFDEEPPSCS